MILASILCIDSLLMICPELCYTLQWRYNGHTSVSNHQPHNCLLNRWFRRRWKKTSKLRLTGLCVGNSPETGESPAQMASNAENVSIWWRHHDLWNLSLQIIPTYWMATMKNRTPIYEILKAVAFYTSGSVIFQCVHSSLWNIIPHCTKWPAITMEIIIRSPNVCKDVSHLFPITLVLSLLRV